MATSAVKGPTRSVQDGSRPERGAWRTFPFRWPDLGRFAVAWLVLTLVFLAVGVLLVHVLADGAVGDLDREAARWFADQRSPTVDDLAQLGAGMADAFVIIPAVAVTSVVFVLIWRRWNEAVLMLTAILLEKAVFVTVTYVIDRDRPPVGQLDGQPPTSSYPSGHVGTAVTFYGVLALVVWAHTDRRWLRVLVVVAATTVAVVVALSRMVLGMHYLTDTVIGAALGAVAVAVGVALTRRTVHDIDARRHLDRGTEAQQPAAEGDGAEGEPRRAEGEARQDVARPVRAEQHA